ncbi:MAG: hypothetical protein IJ349_04120 [Clostridia bacterium]|nr:hypothetical protein [Clostridia bacterium]
MMLKIIFSDGSVLDVAIKYFTAPVSGKGFLYYERPCDFSGCGVSINKNEVDKFELYFDPDVNIEIRSDKQ